MSPEDIREFVHEVPDFPEPGVSFKDITPLLANPRAFSASIEALSDIVYASGASEILAIESRGFIFGAAISRQLSLPLQLVRKPGKLPRPYVQVEYELEYGVDRIQIHDDVIRPSRSYAIVDDLIATGGTASAVAELVSRGGGSIACCAFVVELEFLQGRRKLPDCRIESLIRYD